MAAAARVRLSAVCGGGEPGALRGDECLMCEASLSCQRLCLLLLMSHQRMMSHKG